MYGQFWICRWRFPGLCLNWNYEKSGHILSATQPRKVRRTHLEVIYYMMWLIKPKKYNNQYYADNHLGECSKRQYYWMWNKEQYLRTLSNGCRFWIGLFVVVHYTVQIHPCWELLVDLVSSGQADKEVGAGALGGGGQVPAPYGPSRVWLYNTLISLA